MEHLRNYLQSGNEEDRKLLSFRMPHSREAEQAVLGAMLIDSRCIPEVMGVLKPEDFFCHKTRISLRLSF